MRPDKIRIALLFGGRSAEHDVSIMSARTVLGALDRDAYEVLLVAITRSGRWLLCDPPDDVATLQVPEKAPQVAVLPGSSGRLLVLQEGRVDSPVELHTIDVLFPVLHGPHGEDGSVQALARLGRIACVGADVTASAVALDKDVAKRLVEAAGLRVAAYRTLWNGEPLPTFDEVAETLGRPFFVKPANLGSSVGVSRVEDAAQFKRAVDDAHRHDRKILLEARIAGREIECGVLERPDGSLFVAEPGEVIPTNRHAFYNYDAKYLDENGALLRVPAALSPALATELERQARQVFELVGCRGMARVDFFLTPDDEIFVNEINTIPGFTSISMFPRVLKASGIGLPTIIDELIAVARKRFAAEGT